MTVQLAIEDLHVSVRRGGESLEILRGVSLEIAAGESVGVVGESGSGKTMTIRAITRLLPARAQVQGEIRFAGRSVPSFSDRELRAYRSDDVGVVFQDPHAAINPVRRIGDLLTESYRRESRSARRAARERAEDLLSQVDIRNPGLVLDLYPHQLSGGMLQRVMIAAVLMRDPKLILADEPTTALDVTTQSEVVALLDEVRRARGAAMIFISHDIELVAATCDRILVMYRGRLIESLTPAQLYAGEIAEPYTAALLACRPSITERKHRLPVVPSAAFEERYT
jgi:ABC-type dipeptide/oligopeptide/nickel transport system ATPase component